MTTGNPGLGLQNVPARGPYTNVKFADTTACAERDDGEVHCWGSPISGGMLAPPIIMHLTRGRDQTSCAVAIGGVPECWGANASMDAQPLPSSTRLFASLNDMCGLSSSGKLQCTGALFNAERLAGPFSRVFAGDVSRCGLDADSNLRCIRDDGQLSNVAGSWRFVDDALRFGLDETGGFHFLEKSPFVNINAALLAVPAEDFSTAALEFSHACGLRSVDGRAVCWGQQFVNDNTPPGHAFIDVAVGAVKSCGLHEDGSVVCWGISTQIPTGSFVHIFFEGSNLCGLDAQGVKTCRVSNIDVVDAKGPFEAVRGNGCKVKLDGTLLCTAGHSAGKWYFEVTVDDGGLDGFQQAGVTALKGEGEGYVQEMGCWDEIGNCVSIQGYSTGDVIGVAADLDTGLVSFAVNGEIDASQGFLESRAVAAIDGAGPYFANVILPAGGALHANFGEEAFAFTLPEGFRPYASGLAVDDNGFCVSDAPRPLTPAPVTIACPEGGDELSTADLGAHGDVVLNTFAVYEPASDVVVVEIAQPGRHVVALGSYESVHWRAVATNGAVVERVIATSYDASTVDAPESATVETHSYAAGEQNVVSAGTEWPFELGGGDTLGFVGDAEQRTGLALSPWAGMPRGSPSTTARAWTSRVASSCARSSPRWCRARRRGRGSSTHAASFARRGPARSACRSSITRTGSTSRCTRCASWACGMSWCTRTVATGSTTTSSSRCHLGA